MYRIKRGIILYYLHFYYNKHKEQISWMLEWARGMLRATYFHLQKDESVIPHNMFFMRRKILMLLFGERAWVS